MQWAAHPSSGYKTRLLTFKHKTYIDLSMVAHTLSVHMTLWKYPENLTGRNSETSLSVHTCIPAQDTRVAGLQMWWKGQVKGTVKKLHPSLHSDITHLKALNSTHGQLLTVVSDGILHKYRPRHKRNRKTKLCCVPGAETGGNGSTICLSHAVHMIPWWTPWWKAEKL